MGATVKYRAFGPEPVGAPVLTEVIRREADRLGMDADFLWCWDDGRLRVVARWRDERRTAQEVRTQRRDADSARLLVGGLHDWYADRPWETA
jgi:hypothetical protein